MFVCGFLFVWLGGVSFICLGFFCFLVVLFFVVVCLFGLVSLFNTNNTPTIDRFILFYHEKYKKVWLCWKCQGLGEENIENRCLLFKVTM